MLGSVYRSCARHASCFFIIINLYLVLYFRGGQRGFRDCTCILRLRLRLIVMSLMWRTGSTFGELVL